MITQLRSVKSLCLMIVQRIDSWEWIQKAAKDFPNVHGQRNVQNLGKALTFVNMAHIATGEILIGIDSDCWFNKEAIKELVVCFGDEKVGAVGGIIHVGNHNENLLTQFQAWNYMAAFYLSKVVETAFGKVQCLGGPLVAFKKETYMKILPLIEDRNFLGVKLTNGEDRAITQYILSLGLKTVINFKSKCYSLAPTTWSGYINQQVRWRRSALGQFIEVLVDAPARMKVASVSYVLGSLFPCGLSLVWAMIVFYLFMRGLFLEFLIYFSMFRIITAPIFGLGYNYLMKKTNERGQILKNPVLACCLFALWTPVTILMTVFALLTLDDGGWVTRQNVVAKENV